MRCVHPNTPRQRAGETRKGSLETLSSKNIVKEVTTDLCIFCGPVARCRVSGSAKQKWRFWLVTLVWREWWLQSVWSVAAGDPENEHLRVQGGG